MLATAISDASATAFVAAVDMQQNVPQLYTFPQLFFLICALCAFCSCNNYHIAASCLCVAEVVVGVF